MTTEEVTPDERPESPTLIEPGETAATAIAGFEFEGDLVTDMEGRIPALTLEMPEGYPRGTHVRMQVELRVKSVRYDENRKGDLVRVHVFALEEAQLVAAFNPADAASTVGGSASAHPQQTAAQAEELGVAFGRSSDTWDNPHPGPAFSDHDVDF